MTQDVLAQAVAQEMQKVYRKELAPAPVPLTVPGEVISEEDVSKLTHKLWILQGYLSQCIKSFSSF